MPKLEYSEYPSGLDHEKTIDLGKYNLTESVDNN